jgi:hypothetical protein
MNGSRINVLKIIMQKERIRKLYTDKDTQELQLDRPIL